MKRWRKSYPHFHLQSDFVALAQTQLGVSLQMQRSPESVSGGLLPQPLTGCAAPEHSFARGEADVTDGSVGEWPPHLH